MNVYALLRAQARRRPADEAVVEGQGRRRRALTFAGLDAWAAAGADALRAAGLRPGDVVLLLVPVSGALYAALGALLRAGLTAMLVDPGAGREHLRRALRLCPPAAFVGSPRAHLLRLLVPEVRRISRPFVVGGWAPRAVRWPGPEASGSDDGLDVDERHPALVTFTSGSTGAPKAAVRSHGLLAAQQRAVAAALGLEAGQRDLATLPVFVLANLAAGVTTVLADADLRRPGEVDARRIARQVFSDRPTRCTASPAFFERLLADAPDALAGMERIDTGGAPVFPDLLDRLRTAAPAAHVAAVYGSTEAEPVAHLDAAELSDEDRARIRAGGGLPAGRPVPEVRLRIIRDRWGTPLGPLAPEALDALTCAPGEAGEIVVAGPHVVPGYLSGAGDAETKVRVGDERWHRTGDAGRLDADGRLWLLGRCAAAARDSGSGPGRGALYPLQVEAAARGLPGVRRAAFLALDGRRLLAVEPAESFDGDALRAALAWARLDAVVPVAAIPLDRRHQAKVDYPALRRLLGGR